MEVFTVEFEIGGFPPLNQRAIQLGDTEGIIHTHLENALVIIPKTREMSVATLRGMDRTLAG